MALALSTVLEEPDKPTLIYYNARVALREDQPRTALKLWLLRNALASKTGEYSTHDTDFRTATWVALGTLGYCQDGLRYDNDGAGLWPLALHNWFLKNMRRSEPPDQPPPFDAFQLPQQQRYVTLYDVLSVEELKSVHFYRTDCTRMKDVLASSGQSSSADTTKRDVEVKVLRFLLESARRSIDPNLVKGLSTIDARLLDLRLKGIEILDRKTRRANRRKKVKVKELGGSAPVPIDPAKTPQMARLLSITASWSLEDWLALEPSRRLYLYSWKHRAEVDTSSVGEDLRSNPVGEDAKLQIEIIDRLVAQRKGREVASFIAFGGTTDEAKKKIWSGARGKLLLGLERKTGFRERSALALHRGVDYVGAGRLPDALRSFAFSLNTVDDSRQSDEIRHLSLRWLSFVASQFEVDDELVAMLVALIPRGDLAQILEGLIWSAALSADRVSFDRAVKAHRGRGALLRRVDRLRPLASGDTGAFLTELRDGMTEYPHATLRFVRRFLERLETQDGDVRINHKDTLHELRELLISAVERSTGLRGSLGRRAVELEGLCVAMLDGLPSEAPGETTRDRAGALSPNKEVFAGRIRLAPSDPLPWPFPLPNVRAPSVFTQLPITPVEWRTDKGLVMGWKLGQ